MFKYAITRTSSYELWGPTSTKFVHLHSLSRKKTNKTKQIHTMLSPIGNSSVPGN